MEKLTKVFFLLKSPELVADFQKRCGVELSDSETTSRGKANGLKTDDVNTELDTIRHRNGFSKPVASSEVVDDTFKKTNGHAKNGYCVNGTIHIPEKNGLINHHPQKCDSEEQDKQDLGKSSFRIRNKLLFTLFHFGASLGNEIFYLIFFPFVYWNLDGTLMRQMAFVWHVAMWAGQALKDIICWPRPSSPPVIKLEDRYSLEYGMPSTHATVGTVIPFSLLILLNRYYEVRI